MTFRQRLFIVFGLFVFVLVLITGVFALTVANIRGYQKTAILHAQDVIDAEHLALAHQSRASELRGYLLTQIPALDKGFHDRSAEFEQALAILQKEVDHPRDFELLTRITEQNRRYKLVADQAMAMKKKSKSLEEIQRYFDQVALPVKSQLDRTIDELVAYQQQSLRSILGDASRNVSRLSQLAFATALIIILLSTVLLRFLVHRLSSAFQDKERAVRERDELTAIVSHELRNPITTVINTAELALRSLRRGEGEANLLSHLERIRQSGERMNRLISDLLEMTRIEFKRLVLNAEEIRVSRLVSAAADSARETAEKKQIRLAIELGAEDLTAYCDQSRTLQVLVNLLDNAIKFSEPGKTVTLRAGQDKELAFFEVEDQGPGIAEDKTKRVFEKFWQERSTASLGTGLGLAISKGFVEAQGGHISVSSKLGVGSKFRFDLPRFRSRS